MRIRNFNVSGIAWSNFKPGVDVNESMVIQNFMATIEVVNVCGGVDVSVVTLRGVRGETSRFSNVALTTCLPGAP